MNFKVNSDKSRIKIHLVPKKGVEYVVFNTRWILLAFILKLILNLLLLAYIFFTKSRINNDQLVDMLESLDIAMVAALIEMVITGIYNSHIDKNHGYPNKNITSGVLKIKMGTSLIGVSSIHLLKVFVSEVEPVTLLQQQLQMGELWKKIIIHIAFIIGGVALAIIDKIHINSEAQELLNEEKEQELEHKHKNQKENHEENNLFPTGTASGIHGTA